MMASLYDKIRAISDHARAQGKICGAYNATYESPDGRAMILDMLREAGVLSVAQVAGDPGTSAFNEGKRALGLHILQRLRWSESEIVELARQQTTEMLNNE
jgi:hypothetical protein